MGMRGKYFLLHVSVRVHNNDRTLLSIAKYNVYVDCLINGKYRDIIHQKTSFDVNYGFRYSVCETNQSSERAQILIWGDIHLWTCDAEILEMACGTDTSNMGSKHHHTGRAVDKYRHHTYTGFLFSRRGARGERKKIEKIIRTLIFCHLIKSFGLKLISHMITFLSDKDVVI